MLSADAVTVEGPQDNGVYGELARLWGLSRTAELRDAGAAELAGAVADQALPRVPGRTDDDRRADLLARYGVLPPGPTRDAPGLTRDLVADLFAGAVNWRSPHAQHNVGAAVNAVSAAVQSLALEVNLNLVNDDQGGNAVLAEQAVGRVLARLSDVDPAAAAAVFTSGGSGTVLYGMKAGLRKAVPTSGRTGTPADAVVAVVEGAHFSVARAADWLGIGADRIVVIPAAADRRGDLARAGQLLSAAIEGGARLAAIVVNGGTTLDHTVDDIAGFARLRDRIVADHGLAYRPHLHVDSVIGWPWLCYGTTDPGRVTADQAVASALRAQHRRISAVRHADSWGVDFHKGPGSCALDSSCVVFNDRRDLERLDAGLAVGVSGPDGQRVSNLPYTLETARAGGKAVAALAALHALGAEGIGTILARLVTAAHVLRDRLADTPEWTVLDPDALGYQTMVRAHPPGDPGGLGELLDTGAAAARRVRAGNDYLAAFFAWDDRTRMNNGDPGVLYSFCTAYRTAGCGEPVAALKFYPVSPFTTERHVADAVALLTERKAAFDAHR